MISPDNERPETFCPLLLLSVCPIAQRCRAKRLHFFSLVGLDFAERSVASFCVVMRTFHPFNCLGGEAAARGGGAFHCHRPSWTFVQILVKMCNTAEAALFFVATIEGLVVF